MTIVLDPPIFFGVELFISKGQITELIIFLSLLFNVGTIYGDKLVQTNYLVTKKFTKLQKVTI